MSWCDCQIYEECEFCRPIPPNAEKSSGWETIKQERNRLHEELNEALLKIELLENTIADLNQRIAVLES